jgi:hypothetical protein
MLVSLIWIADSFQETGIGRMGKKPFILALVALEARGLGERQSILANRIYLFVGHGKNF